MRLQPATYLLLLAAAGTVRAVETTQRLDVPLRSAERVVLSEINGPVEITGSTDDVMRVEIVRIGPSSPLPAGTLEVKHLSGAVRLTSTDFRLDPERVRNRLRIELPRNSALDVSAIRGELVVDAPLAEVHAFDIRGAVKIQQATSVEAVDIGGSVAIVGASTVDLRNVRGSASVVTDQDGAVISIDEQETSRIGWGKGRVSLRNIDGAVQVREKP